VMASRVAECSCRFVGRCSHIRYSHTVNLMQLRVCADITLAILNQKFHCLLS
jgi:hypothetical protein